jgi:hypothetical protein
MTTLERLTLWGLLESFDAAIRSKDNELAINILERVQIPRREGASIVKRIFDNPKFYGYQD